LARHFADGTGRLEACNLLGAQVIYPAGSPISKLASASTRKDGRYVGTVTFVIRDSYGFSADDTLDGFGPPMRYLQTTCGAPQHAGGAHWFPDAITVTVPFNQPAAS